MSSTLPSLPVNTTQLVRYLTELSVADISLSHGKFIQNIAQFTNFSGSLTLFDAHTDLNKLPSQPAGGSAEAIVEQFLNSRTNLLALINSHFAMTEEASRIQRPVINDQTSAERAADYALHKPFYIAIQNEIDFKIRALRLDIRAAIAELSPKLAKLAALDAALADTLAKRSRDLLAAVPQLLTRRFQQLQEEHPQQLSVLPPLLWLQAGGWLAQFYSEMQCLLLAELDLRLLPVLGLLEALNDEVNHRD
jgi:hypothetical protein